MGACLPPEGILQTILKKDLNNLLFRDHGIEVIGSADLAWLRSRPRHELYRMISSWRRDYFDPDQRIVFYGNEVDAVVLQNIQEAVFKVDINNCFVMICSPTLDQEQLRAMRDTYGHDPDNFDHVSIQFVDHAEFGTHDLLDLPSSFCFSPWAHLEISSTGEFRPCCVYRGYVKKSDGTTYNIQHDSVESVYHSTHMIELRDAFRAGERPDACQACWKVEDAGSSNSHRHWTTQRLGIQADIIDIEQDNAANLVSFDVKLGNTCNFKCRICNEQSSSLIAAEKFKHGMVDRPTIELLNRQGTWSEDSQTWKEIAKFANQIVNIDFYGGEPFLAKAHHDLVHYLADSSRCSSIRLHYNTNGSIYPEKLFDVWSLFREIDISFSIDNLASRFELERCNGSWALVEQNLDRFVRDRLPNMRLSVFVTVNAQNVCYLADVIDWYETKDFDALIFSVLSLPKVFAISNMPAGLARLAQSRLRGISPERRQKYGLEAVLNLVDSAASEQIPVDELVDTVLKLDQWRDQRFDLSHPEVAEAINYDYYRKKHG